MSYEQLSELLSPSQRAQLEIVRQHLLQDPTALDRGASEDGKDGTEEGS